MPNIIFEAFIEVVGVVVIVAAIIVGAVGLLFSGMKSGDVP